MRTTVRLDEALLRDAKRLAAASGRSLTTLIEDALREVLLRHGDGPLLPSEVVLPTFGGRGLRPGINLDDSAALLDLMDDGH